MNFVVLQGYIQIIIKVESRVAWKEICKPKDQGGLGLKNLERWNDVFLIKLICNILTCKNTIWVDWIRSNRLKDKNFWEVDQCNQASWMWNYLLSTRGVIRSRFVTKIGDGRSTSVWFDDWSRIGPLCNFITNRNIYEANLQGNFKVAEMIENGVRRWPEDWEAR